MNGDPIVEPIAVQTPSSSGVAKLAVVVAVASLLFSAWTWRQLREVQAQVAARPPIAIVPVDSVLQEAVSTDSSGHAIDQADARIKDIAKRLRSQGYIVLDGSHLVAYPKSFEVRPDQGDSQ